MKREFLIPKNKTLYERMNLKNYENLQFFNFWVLAVCWSPDGNYIAAASANNSVTIWQVKDSTQPSLVHILAGHTEVVRSVAYSPDGNSIASSSNDGTVKIWNSSSGKLKETLEKQHTNHVNCVAWKPDGTLLGSAAGGYDQSINIWNSQTWQVQYKLTGHHYIIRSIAWHPKNKPYVAAASFDDIVTVWNIETQKKVKIFTGHTGKVLCVAWHPDGKQLASGAADNAIKIWDVSDL